MSHSQRENSVFLTSTCLLTVSVFVLIPAISYSKLNPYLAGFGLLIFSMGLGFGIYAAWLFTEPGETVTEMTKIGSHGASTNGEPLVMKKAAGA